MLENDFCNFSKTSFLAREPNEMKEVSSPFPPPLRFPLYIVQKFNILYFFFLTYPTLNVKIITICTRKKKA